MKPKVLRPVRPNYGIEVEFRRRLYKLLEEMSNSVMYWLTAAYRKHEPLMAMDSPASEIRKYFRELAKRWLRNWNEGAVELAKYFARDVRARTDNQLRKILRDAGISVQFTMTDAMRDVLHATIHQNVALIRSIPQQYLTQVEQLVMQSVQQGRKLDELTRELERRYHLTRQRAALIARDQNNKATASMTRARQTELGIESAMWLHSHAGKQPRPQHVKMDGRTYNVRVGMWDPVEQKHVFPGELINCRCSSKSIIPGLT